MILAIIACIERIKEMAVQVAVTDEMLSNECVLASAEVQALKQIIRMTHEDLMIKNEQKEMSDYTSGDNSRSVGIDTCDLNSYIKERTKSIDVLNKSIAVDTSDLELHYEYYKQEHVKRTKTVSTDTRDLDYLKRVTSTSAVSVDTNDLQIYIDTHFANISCHNGICKTETDLDCDAESTPRCSQQNSNSRNATPLSPKSNDCYYHQKEERSKSKDGNCSLGSRPTQNTEDDSSNDNKLDCGLDINGDSDSSENEDSCEGSTTKGTHSEIKVEENNERIVPTKRKVGRPKGTVSRCVKSANRNPERRFECEVCKAMFTRKHSLMVHLCIHSGLRPFPCSGCGKAFSTSSQAQRHARMHPQASADEIVKEEPGSDTGIILNEHKDEDEEADVIGDDFTGVTSLHCMLCDLDFDCKQSFTQHKRAAHGLTNRQTRECLTCGKAFTCASALKCHETVHTGKRDFACVTCGKAFPTKTCLKAHEATHTGLKRFVCQTCGKAFAKKDSLKVHNRKHTNERPFSCDLCGRSFDRAFTLKNHRLTHTGEKTHMCAVCGKAFSTRGALSTHERIRHNTDPDKPKVYKRRARDFEPSVCEQCGKVYSNRGNLRIHKASAHSTEKPFLCTACGRSFAKKYTLQCHARKHSNERPFPCDQCSQSFYRKSTLKTHKLRHTGARPYVCPLNCGKAFTQSSSLSYHVRHHDRPPRATNGKKRRRRKPKSGVRSSPLMAPLALVGPLPQPQEPLPPPPPLTFNAATYQPNGAPPCGSTQSLAQL
ncbi:zinc finger protein 135 isoform X2 [Cryptotermes secundus]|uniref:zinc finger protein 135 isoform X2 n=1 Tax=Cryptotermes secundus TaxID=105785 RepID=UPI001454CB40|nr:zinc finger protein 135 isoform X2 [Cryptotermes secundus]